MRLGPIAVPGSIAAAILVIVAAEAGWFDGAAPEPSFLRAGHVAQKVAVAPAQTPARGPSENASTPAEDDAPIVGRSVGRAPIAAGTELGSGGASLDADGVAAAGPQDLLRQAREEAAKAKQDVLDVTRASLDSQHASEAEFARQREELTQRNTALTGELETVRAEATALQRQLAGATGTASDKDGLQRQLAQSEAAAKAVAEALARSRDQETALRAEVATLKGESERKGAAAAAAEKKAGDATTARDAALATRAEDAGRAEDLARTEGARLAAEHGRSAALAAELAALRKGAAGLRLALTVETSGAARLREAAAAATRREASLGRDMAETRARAVADVAEVHAAADAATREANAKASAAEEALAHAQGTVQDLRQKLAASAAEAERQRVAVASRPAAFEPVGHLATEAGAAGDVATLKGDLDGARRGEATLRKENGLLQRQLAEAQANGRALEDRLAALQDGTEQGRQDPPSPRRGHGRSARPSVHAVEHQRLLDELSRLQRSQMEGELEALRHEARGMARPHSRRARQEARDARLVVVEPPIRATAGASRRRERASAGDAAGPAVSGKGDEARATIAQAKAMIRDGHLDAARHLLSQHGGAAATRALADSYNPLTNTEYGALGVNSDADKAALLYQQAGRMAARDR